MNPVSEYDILKYMLIVYRRLTPASELEGIPYGVNYEYKSFIGRHYKTSAAGLEQLTVEVERKTPCNLANYIKRRYGRV